MKNKHKVLVVLASVVAGYVLLHMWVLDIFAAPQIYRPDMRLVDAVNDGVAIGELEKLLEQSPELLDLQPMGCSALYLAVLLENREAAQFLVDRGASFDVSGDSLLGEPMRSLIEVAILNRDDDTLKLLLRANQMKSVGQDELLAAREVAIKLQSESAIEILNRYVR